MLSADATYRPPLERWLPLVAYLEYGIDDGAGGSWSSGKVSTALRWMH
jgi:hypothetical protein